MIEFTVATPYTTFFFLSLSFLLDKYQSSIRSGHSASCMDKAEQDTGENSVVFSLNLRPAFTLLLLAELLKRCSQTALTLILVVFPSLQHTTTRDGFEKHMVLFRTTGTILQTGAKCISCHPVGGDNKHPV